MNEYSGSFVPASIEMLIGIMLLSPQKIMKTVQKLEIIFGLATFISAIAYFCVNMLPYAKFVYDNYGVSDSVTALLQGVLLIIIPGVLTAGGAYFWAIKASRLGFAAVICGGSILSILFGLSNLVAAMYSKGIMERFLITIPLISAILTVLFAFPIRKLFRSSK